MKKLMLSSMILLPLILLLILSLSTAFVSMTSYIYVDSVEILNSDEILYIDKANIEDEPQFQLVTNVFPMFASNKNLLYSSENEDVLSINEDGLITAHEYGETYVKIQAQENDAKQSRRKVVVTNDKIQDIRVENLKSSMYVGEEYQLQCLALPINAKDKGLLYSSSNTNVLDVTMSGKLKAKAFGNAIITITPNGNKNFSKSFNVAVKEKLIDVKLMDQNTKISLDNNTAQFSELLIYPKNADIDIRYESSDENIATIDAAGNIEFLKSGMAILSVIIVDNSKEEGSEDREHVFTKEYSYYNGYIQDIEILCKNTYDYDEYLGKYLDISFDIIPLEYDKNNLIITFLDDNSREILEINSKNQIKAKKPGIATIKILYYTSPGKYTQLEKTIEITRKAQDISFSAGTNTGLVFYTLNNTIDISSSSIPSDATYNIVYSTQDKDISINGNKIIFDQTLDYKEVNILATTNDDMLQKTFKVVYINKNKVKVINVENDNTFDIVLPKSHITDKTVKIAFLPNINNINSVEIKKQGQDISLINISETGETSYRINVNGIKFADVKLNAIRLVEDIRNISVTNSSKDANDRYYTASNVVTINSNLYPVNTTIKAPTYEVKSGAATLAGNELTFNSIGEVVVLIKADVEKEIKIYSTMGHPDSNIKVYSEKTIMKGESLSKADFIEELSPMDANLEYMDVKTDSLCLKNNLGIITGKFGGVGNVTVNLTLDKGQITKVVKVNVLEDPETIKLNKNYFVVETSNYVLQDTDFSILPSTANNNLSYTLSSTEEGVTINGNSISYDGSGLVMVTITLKNNVKVDMYLLFKGKTKVVDFSSDIPELAIGDKFIAKVPLNVSKNYKGITNIVGLSYTNGIFEVNKAVNAPLDEFSSSFDIAGHTYKVKGYIKAKGIKFDVLDNGADKTENGFVTANKEIDLKASPLNLDATYKEFTYELVDPNANITDLGHVTFNKACSVVIKVKHVHEGIEDSIELRCTNGLVESVSVDLSDVTLDYDDPINNQISLKDHISVFPSQAIKEDNIKLVLYSGDIAGIDNSTFSIKALKGGETYVLIQYKDINGDYKESTAYIKLNIKRKAMGINLNGVSLLPTQKVEINDKGFVQLNTQVEPVDANVGTNVSMLITRGENFAIIEDDNLIFLAANKEIDVTFKLNDVLTYVVTYIATGEIDIKIDLSKDTIVIPYESEFTFINKPSDYVIPEDLFRLNVNNGKYKAIKSINTDITIGNIKKNLIITRRLSKIDNIYAEDYDNNLKGNTEILLSSKHITASKHIKLYTKDINIYNVDGNIIRVNLSVDNIDIANLSNDVLTFNKAGTAIVTAVVDAEDYYGPYQVIRKIEIESTFGLATDFTVDDVALVDEFRYNFQNKIVINKPLYGGNDISFNASSIDMNVNGLSIEALKTGINKVDISCTNGATTMVDSVNVTIDVSVSNIVFENNTNVIKYDITNFSSYVLEPILYSNCGFKPTLTNIHYELLSGDANLENNTIKFAKDYTIATIKVTAESGVNTEFKVVKVASDVTIVDVKNNDSIVVENTKKYAFNMISDEFNANILVDPNINVIDKNTLTIMFINGGKYTYKIKGQTLNFIITEEVENIYIDENELLVSENKYITAKNNIDLDTFLNPTYYPSTAYNESGKINLTYSLLNGPAIINKHNIVFNSQGIAEIKITAGNKFITVYIESTMGYVKDAKFISNINKNLDEKQFALTDTDYSIIPKDVNRDMYGFDTSSKNIKINGNVVTLLSEGSATINIAYHAGLNNIQTVETNLYVHNPITDIIFNYNGYDINRIILPISNGNQYKLNYSFVDGVTAPTKVEFLSNSVLSVDNNGIVTFNKTEEFGIVTIKIINSNGTTYEENIELLLTEYPLIVVDNKTNDQKTITIDKTNANVYIFALPINGLIKYEVTPGNDTFTVDQNGLLKINKGGNGKVNISNSYYQKELEIFVHTKTESIEVTSIKGKTQKGNAIYTAQKELDLNPLLLPSDSAFNKVVNYNYDKASDIAYMEGSKLIFKKKGQISINIVILYNNAVECNLVLDIISTFGSLDSYKIIDESNNFLQKYNFDSIGIEHEYKFTQMIPNDYIINDFDVLDDNGSNALQILKTTNGFKLKSIGKGTGTIIVLLDNIQARFNFEAKIKVSSILVDIYNKNIQNGNTYITTLDELNITNLVVNPLDANDPSLIWEISNDGQIVDNKIILPSLKSYTVTIKSNDGGYKLQFIIEKINALQDFSLHYQLTIGGVDNKQVVQDVLASSNSSEIMKIKPSHNELIILLHIEALPTNLIGEVSLEAFNIICPEGITYNINHNIISINLPEGVFNDDVIVRTGEAMITVNIFKDGITAINFKNHDNTNDLNYGLQQVRIFGNKSYYNGAVQNYYNLPVEVSSLSGQAVPVFKSSNPMVTFGQYNAGILPIYFNDFGNTVDENMNNNFSKQVTITATDNSGTIRYSYTFHVVRDFVNVFDMQGLTTQPNVVLHKHFESPTEISAHKNTQEDYVELNLDKPLDLALHPERAARYQIIGNGYTINFYTANGIKTLHDKGRLRIELERVINCTLKGADMDKTKKNYHVLFRLPYSFYNKFQNCLQGIYMVPGSRAKNCLFMYIKEMSLQNSSWANNITYIENVMALDGGWTMVDCQQNGMHIKGFVDAYNFQSANGLKNISPLVNKTMANLILQDFKRDHGVFGEMTDDGLGINTVIFVHKENKDKLPINLLMYNGKDQAGNDIYIEKLDPGANANQKYVGTDYAAPGLTRLTSLTLKTFGHICSYNPTTTHFTYAHQKDMGGWMARQQQKVLRTYDGGLFDPVM